MPGFTRTWRGLSHLDHAQHCSPLMAGTYVCSSVYTLWHPKSIPNMSSKIPAWRWQRSKCPCLSSQIWSQSSSCWVFWIQTLLPDTLSMSLAPPPCSHSDSVTIKCYPNRRAVHMRAGRGHSHHPLCAVLSKLTFYFPHSFHSKAPCNLPCFVLVLLYLFACFFLFFLIHPPIQGIIIRVFEEKMVLFSYGPVLLLHWRSDHRPWMLEYIEHAVYHWAIANLLYRLLRSRPTDLIYAKFKWDQRHLRAITVVILIGSFVHFLGLALKSSSFVWFACFFIFPAILKVWGGEGSKRQRF